MFPLLLLGKFKLIKRLTLQLVRLQVNKPLCLHLIAQLPMVDQCLSEVWVQEEELLLQPALVGLAFVPCDVSIPHVQGFPLSESAEKGQVFYSVVGVAFFEPVCEGDELDRVATDIVTQPLYTNSIVLLLKIRILLLNRVIVHNLQVIRIRVNPYLLVILVLNITPFH